MLRFHIVFLFSVEKMHFIHEVLVPYISILVTFCQKQRCSQSTAHIKAFGIFKLVLSRRALQPRLQKLISRVHKNIGLGGSCLLKITSVMLRLSLSKFYNQCSLMLMVCSRQL